MARSKEAEIVLLAQKLSTVQEDVRKIFGEGYDTALAPCKLAIRDRMEHTGEGTLLAAITVARISGMPPSIRRMYLAAGLELVSE